MQRFARALLIAIATPIVQAGPIITVDDNAANDPGPGDSAVSDPMEDGSVQHPYDSIQEAIAAANSGDEIVVEPGLYSEAIDFLGKGIAVRSSAGPEVTTIDATGLEAPVVTFQSGEPRGTALEGFTITGGSGQDLGGVRVGGGVFISFSAPFVTHCVITGNSAEEGGGLYGVGSALIEDCSFSGNTADRGGGVHSWLGAPQFADCSFTKNTAALGGGMYQRFGGQGTVRNCAFTENTSSEEGGGLWTESPLQVTDCTFTSNAAARGGGFFGASTNGSTLSFCSFSDNAAEMEGGGAWLGGLIPQQLNECSFTANAATFGGGLYACSGDAEILFCSFQDNTGVFGGGLYLNDGDPFCGTLAPLSFGFSTMAGNTADLGGAMYVAGSLTGSSIIFSGNGALFGGGLYLEAGEVEMTACGLSSNTASIHGGAVYQILDATLTMTACPLTGNSAGSNGGGIYTLSSELTMTGCTLSANTGGDRGGGLHARLATVSLVDCTFSACTANEGGGIFHQDGVASIVGCGFLSNSATHTGGGAWLQAIDAQISSSVVEGNSASSSAGGMYMEAVGALAGEQQVLTDCEFTANQADDFGGGLQIIGGSTSIGTTLFSENAAGSCGGGIEVRQGEATINACSFTENTGQCGGGAYLFQSSVQLLDCDFDGNEADSGGGIYNTDSLDTLVRGCRIQNNTATQGAGILQLGSTGGPSLYERCEIKGNIALDGGGGLDCTSCGSTIVSSLFADNFAELNGGAVRSSGSPPVRLINCTVVEGTANSGDAIWTQSNAAASVFENSVLWFNGMDPIVGPVDIRFSNVEGGAPGIGNIAIDPGFVDPVAGDFCLAAGSPCIDAADNSAVPADQDLDLNGGPRFVDDPATTDTGVGARPIVDMGSDEFDPTCGGDTNDDGAVDVLDLVMVITSWDTDDRAADVNGDGVVNVEDLVAIITSWGICT